MSPDEFEKLVREGGLTDEERAVLARVLVAGPEPVNMSPEERKANYENGLRKINEVRRRHSH